MAFHPSICNDEMAAVSLGSRESSNKFYCGRRDAERGRRCGPENGTPCQSCRRLVAKPGIRLETLGLQFPSLGQDILAAILRKNGGSLSESAEALAGMGAARVPAKMALPGSYHQLIDLEPAPPINENHEEVDQVMEFCAVDRNEAQAAFQKNPGASVLEVVEYALSVTRDDLQCKFIEYSNRREAYNAALVDANIQRENALREAAQAEVPEVVLQLVQPLQDKSELQNNEAPDSGHLLVPYKETQPDGQPIPATCTVCDSSLHNAGGLYCPTCGLCETCVRQRVLFYCPRMANGGPLHHHPLTHLIYGQDTNCRCDVEGESCARRGNLIRWKCSACDFHVCSECMSHEAPVRWHNRHHTIRGASDKETPIGTQESNESRDSIEEAGVKDPTPLSSSNEIAVSSRINPSDQDEIGPSSHDQKRAASRTEDFARCYPVKSVDFAERLAAFQWEGTFLMPHLVTGAKNGGKKRYSSLPGLKHSARHDKPLEQSEQDALKSFASHSKETQIVSACKMQTIENLLRLGRNNMTKEVYSEFEKAISDRRVDIAAMYLFANAYAPSLGKRKLLCPVCYLDIDTPQGAVGCLKGHAMHPGCAADFLLGSDSCPICQEPICFPETPQTEVRAAVEAVEVMQKERKETERMKLEGEMQEAEAQGKNFTFHEDDIVQISQDLISCKKEAMRRPKSIGWFNDMEFACGLRGCVTKVLEVEEGGVLKQVAVQVLTEKSSHQYTHQKKTFECGKCRTSICVHCQQCPKCAKDGGKWTTICSKSRVSWWWPPSMLIPLGRKDASALYIDCVKDSRDFIQVAETDTHILRLRAELRAIVTSRVTTDMELQEMASKHAKELLFGLGDGEAELLGSLFGKISPADVHRARHLLALTTKWDGTEAKEKLQSLLREGKIDSAARVVRRYNAAQTIENCRWQEATSKKIEYVVDSFLPVALHASPSPSAPRTGHYLQPWARFFGNAEVVSEEDGELWIHAEGNNCWDPLTFQGLVQTDQIDWQLQQALPGATVRRGRDWWDGDTDGGEGNVGIIQSVPRPGNVKVQWKKTGRAESYRAGLDGKYDLEFVAPPPPLPEGWMCAKPVAGSKASYIVQKGRSALRCFSCGDGLEAPCQLPRNFKPLENSSSVREGDVLLVASSLAPVVVTKLRFSDSKKRLDWIGCSFQADHPTSNKRKKLMWGGCDSTSSTTWYQPKDLMHPVCSEISDSKEYVSVDGEFLSRRDFFLRHGSISDAKKAWEKHANSSKITATEFHGEDVASCVRGHLLHSRCFQGALVAGGRCPARGCTEYLWGPQTKKVVAEDDACCGSSSQAANIDAIPEANDDSGETVLADQEVAIGNRELKMCPVCYYGPMFNDNCDDMDRHHGQCSIAAMESARCDFTAPRDLIARNIASLSSGQRVADVLPRCPDHDVIVMFNGCMQCGHLFTNTPWRNLPKWDPAAKARLVSTVLEGQIRRETALLQFERSALNLSEDMERDLQISPPHLPPPAETYGKIDKKDARDNGGSGNGFEEVEEDDEEDDDDDDDDEEEN